MIVDSSFGMSRVVMVVRFLSLHPSLVRITSKRKIIFSYSLKIIGVTRGVTRDNYSSRTIFIIPLESKPKDIYVIASVCGDFLKLVQFTKFQLHQNTQVRVEILSVDKISIRTCVFA